MLKRLPFAMILSAVFVLPSFSLDYFTDGSMCDINSFGVDNGDVELEAVWEPVSATCDAGTYFSAEAATASNTACVTCPAGFYCAGVTAAYDGEDYGKVQCPDGISAPGSSSVEDCISQVVCNAGTYLPGESSTCVQCLENHWCRGDTFVIGVEEDQGIDACADGLHSPVGSRVEQDCGRVLKVRGDDNVERVLHLHAGDKRTEPSLAVKIDGVTYYADTTPVIEGVKTLDGRDAGETDVGNVLRIKVNDVEYSVHETIYE